MAKITPNQDFLHGRDRFKKGKEYDVDDTLAAYFAFNGWADAPDLPTGIAPEEVTLDIKSTRHTTKSTVKED